MDPGPTDDRFRIVDPKGVPAHHEGTLEPNYYCRAWNPRRSKYCKSRAGAATQHMGAGRCKTHDGGGDNKVTHGLHRRYQFTDATRIKDLVERLEEDEHPLDTGPELTLLRALAHDFIERYDRTTTALLAWHRSWGPKSSPLSPEHADALRRVMDEHETRIKENVAATEGQRDDLKTAREALEFLWAPLTEKPHTIPDLVDAGHLLDKITKAVERIERTKSQNHITYDQLKRFLFGIDRVLSLRVTDPTLLAQLRHDCLTVSV